MNDEPATAQPENDVLPSMSFEGRAEYIPGLILEQLISTRALLGAMFTLQLELLAHLTADPDPAATREGYVERLHALALEYAAEAKASLERQSPLE
jgi:hypothetical protein